MEVVRISLQLSVLSPRITQINTNFYCSAIMYSPQITQIKQIMDCVAIFLHPGNQLFSLPQRFHQFDNLKDPNLKSKIIFHKSCFITSIIIYICIMTHDKINREDVEALLQLCKVEGDINLNGIQWSESLIQLGIKHGVGAWCYYRIKNSSLNQPVPEEVMKPWKHLYFHTSIVNQHKLNIFFEIQDLLKEVGIPVIGLKGIALVGNVYTDEGLRPMGDIDLLVPEGEGLRALDVLLKGGATQNFVPRSALHEQVHAHVRAITYKGVLIEIHQRLFSLGNPYHIATDYFKYTENHAIGCHQMTVLNDVWFGYHLVSHVASNIYKGGLRLGWLVDIALLFLKQANVNDFISEITQLYPNKLKDIKKVCYMALLLISKPEMIHQSKNISGIEGLVYQGVAKKHSIKKHKQINILESIRVPGIIKKLRLLLRELFPAKEYMIKRYKSDETVYWKWYYKRLWPF